MGLEQRIPMVGFPHHAADAYFKKIRQSYSVVVVDGEDVRKLDTFGMPFANAKFMPLLKK